MGIVSPAVSHSEKILLVGGTSHRAGYADFLENASISASVKTGL